MWCCGGLDQRRNSWGTALASGRSSGRSCWRSDHKRTSGCAWHCPWPRNGSAGAWDHTSGPPCDSNWYSPCLSHTAPPRRHHSPSLAKESNTRWDWPHCCSHCTPSRPGHWWSGRGPTASAPPAGGCCNRRFQSIASRRRFQSSPAPPAAHNVSQVGENPACGAPCGCSGQALRNCHVATKFLLIPGYWMRGCQSGRRGWMLDKEDSGLCLTSGLLPRVGIRRAPAPASCPSGYGLVLAELAGWGLSRSARCDSSVLKRFSKTSRSLSVACFENMPVSPASAGSSRNQPASRREIHSHRERRADERSQHVPPRPTFHELPVTEVIGKRSGQVDIASQRAGHCDQGQEANLCPQIDLPDAWNQVHPKMISP